MTNDQKVVLIHRLWRGREYWVTPGGGVEEGENLEEALVREVREEIGVGVRVQEFLKTLERTVDGEQSIQHFFLCRITDGVVGTGTHLGRNTSDDVSDVVTLGSEEIAQINLVPEEIKEMVLTILKA